MFEMTTQSRAAAALDKLYHPYPTSEALRMVLSNGSRRDREAIVRLWLSEGLPFAFRNHPAIFERIRACLGERIGVDPKEITIIGSARIGYSLVEKNFGRPFSNQSDLDFSIISATLFSKLTDEFRCFNEDYSSGKIQPRNKNQKRYWPQNIPVCANNLKRGFLDTNKIPSYDRYPTVQNINNSMWFITDKLGKLEDSLQIAKSSAHVYENWKTFVDQCTLNLFHTTKRLREPRRPG